MPQMYVLDGEGELEPMTERPYDSEAVLQNLLADFPTLLPGDLINADNPRRWLLIRTEAGVAFEGEGGSRWWIDNLYIDQDGVPTLVEVKRATDTRARREVVAQMLDYASSFVFSGSEEIRSRFEDGCASEADASDQIAELLGELAEPDIEAFWSSVETNLRSGKIRLVFVADSLSKELKRIIEFLNMQFSQAEVIGVEIRQWVRDGGMRTLVPTVFGNTVAAEATKGSRSSGPRLTLPEFVSYMEERRAPATVSGVKAVMDWCQANGGYLSFGRSTKFPGCYLNWTLPSGKAIWPWAMYASGTVEVAFETLVNRPPFDSEILRSELRERLMRVNGLTIRPDALRKRPSFRLDLLADPDNVALFIEALAWFRDVVVAESVPR